MSGEGRGFYSQHGEDFLLWKFFKEKREGFYVDVGAFDGVHLSNTYYFELQGWRGICIEPHPDYFPLCERARPRSVCVNTACVGDGGLEKVDFFSEESGLYSSALGGQEDSIGRHYREGWGLEFKGLKKITVPASTLNAVLEKHLPEGTPIDFVSIDVEGTETDVLRGLDIERFAPRVFVMETNSEDAKTAIASYLGRHGYIEARQLGVNCFFVRSAEDAGAIAGITVAYAAEKCLHPLGKDYTVWQCVEGGPRSEREYYLRQLRKQAERNQALTDNLNRHIEAQLAKIDELKGIVLGLEAEKKRLEAELSSRDETINNLKKRLDNLETSTSWKATASLRRAAGIAKKMMKGEPTVKG